MFYIHSRRKHFIQALLYIRKLKLRHRIILTLLIFDSSLGKALKWLSFGSVKTVCQQEGYSFHIEISSNACRRNYTSNSGITISDIDIFCVPDPLNTWLSIRCRMSCASQHFFYPFAKTHPFRRLFPQTRQVSSFCFLLSFLLSLCLVIVRFSKPSVVVMYARNFNYFPLITSFFLGDPNTRI